MLKKLEFSILYQLLKERGKDTALPCPYRALLIIGIRLRIVAIVFKLKTISDLVNLLKSFKQLFSVTFVPIASTAPAEPGLQCK